MKIKVLKLIFFILSITVLSLTVSSVHAKENVMTQGQGNVLINQLNQGLLVLEQWSNKNTNELNALKTMLKEQKQNDSKNNTFDNKETWMRVNKLNKEYLLMLEASYAMSKHQEALSDLKSQEQKTNAFSVCLNLQDCNFEKINELIDTKSLKLYEFTKQSAKNTQKSLIDSINDLQEFSFEAQNSQGLNNSIDALTKVNTTQANVLVALNNQIGNLSKLTAENLQNSYQKEKMKALADKKALKAIDNIKSDHMSLMLGDIK